MQHLDNLKLHPGFWCRFLQFGGWGRTASVLFFADFILSPNAIFIFLLVHFIQTDVSILLYILVLFAQGVCVCTVNVLILYPTCLYFPVSCFGCYIVEKGKGGVNISNK